MKHIFTLLKLSMLCLIASIATAQAQTNVGGKILDEATGEPVVGVNITVKGTLIGTITNLQGEFSLRVNTPPPFTLLISAIGYASQELEITGNNDKIEIKLAEQTIMGQEVVVSASRVEENIMKSPVTVEKMDIIAVQQSPSPDFFDGLARMKGVQSTSGSMTFNSINTRGFATIANVRFVQLIDGMDSSAPTLNFPTGNLVGMSELDAESIELVPGAASALYGPNAFNGIMFMNSKSPFDYQGFSANAKLGVTRSTSNPAGGTAHGTNPYRQLSLRYAKAFDNRFAFKVNFSYLGATDWRANNYNAYRTDQFNYGQENLPAFGSRDFDGWNSYGEETSIAQRSPFNSFATANQVATGIVTAGGLPAGFSGIITQTLMNYRNQLVLPTLGFREEDLIDNNDASSIKGDLALHYRINDKLEAIYNYRIGTGRSFYQGANRYALRDFSIQFQKLELRGSNFFVRGYMTQTDAGNSYNVDAMGLQMFTKYAPELLGAYMGQVATVPQAAFGGQPLLNAMIANPNIPASVLQPILNQYALNARAQFDLTNPNLPEGQRTRINQDIVDIRNEFFKRERPGASFRDNSRLWHAEGNYNFKDLIDFMEVQVGGNFRRYDLFSDNTVFNEFDGRNTNRIRIDEFGGYLQIAKSLIEDRLKLTGSIRYDKNQNFQGQWNPRISAVYSFGEKRQNNIRASYQTGFRNPDTQAQFIYFGTATGILLGSTRANAERYGIHEGGATDLQGNPIFLNYVQPERLQALELGYKGLIGDKLLVDLNGYYNKYTNFIANQVVLSRNGGNVPGTGAFAPGTRFAPYVNSSTPLSSWGVGVGLTYRLPKGYMVSGNYNWADFDVDTSNDPGFLVGFNTPRNKFNIGVSNREVVKNLGFDINYRWQQGFKWESTFAVGDVPAFGVIDAAVSYKMKSIKSILKLGGSNIGGKDYITNFGGPFIGSMYYISFTFDEFLR